MTAKNSALRGFTLPGASFLLRITLGGSVLLSVTSGIGWADPTPVGDIEATNVTINPTTGSAALTLEGPAFDTSDYGLTLSYHDKTSSDATSYAVIKIHRPNGQYQWMFTAPTTPDRLAMRLEGNHTLKVYDPAHLGDDQFAIVLRPGSAPGSGVFWNDQQLATVQQVNAGFVPLVNGGVGIGTATPGYPLDVVGTSASPLASFSSSTGNAAQIRFASGSTAAKFLGLDSQSNFFVKAADGQTSLLTVQDGGNVGIGASNPAAKLDVEGTMQVGGSVLNWPNPTLWVDPSVSAVSINCAFTGYSNWAKLYVNGQIWSSGITTWAYQFGGIATGTNYYTGSLTILDGDYNGRIWIGKHIASAYDITFGDEDLRFVGINEMEILRLNNENGNVGIATDDPQTKLDVNGDATVRGNATIQGDFHVQGVFRVVPAGDIGMGDFTAGTNPNPPQP